MWKEIKQNLKHPSYFRNFSFSFATRRACDRTLRAEWVISFWKLKESPIWSKVKPVSHHCVVYPHLKRLRAEFFVSDKWSMIIQEISIWVFTPLSEVSVTLQFSLWNSESELKSWLSSGRGPSLSITLTSETKAAGSKLHLKHVCAR